MSNYNKPKVKLIGQDGNVFNIIGKVVAVLKRDGYTEKALEFYNRAVECRSYEEVLCLVAEFVEVE